MSKTAKILIILGSLALLLVLYLIFSSNVVTVSQEDISPKESKQTQEEKQVNSKKIISEYQASAIEIFSDFKDVINKISTLQEESDIISTSSEEVTEEPKEENISRVVSDIKQRLMSLTVPTEFKDLHIEFVLAVSKISSFLINEEENDKIESIEILDELEKNYTWLNPLEK